ncbi:MAG: serine/threonine protein kinase [Polyangiaceae bacterium]
MSLAPPTPLSLAPGFKLDRYELLCPIAEGGMAAVWVARQTGKHGFEKLVAIKMILPKFASDPVFQKMFRDEARIASRIEHTNAAQILDVGEQHDVTYLVMEYVDGDALSSIHRALKRQSTRIPPGVVLRVMADACGALHSAHELRDGEGVLLGVVHRDVSPQNVLVSTKGLAKIIDFGIAKARDRVAGDTSSGQVKGKVRYMAPEQALGRVIDRRADLWAVGAILYHMLSGKPPYDGDSDVQTLMALTSGLPPLPLPPAVPAAVAAVVKRALKPAPDGRFATAAEMQDAIEEAMVQAKLTTSVAAVASFLGQSAGDRAQKRKDAIALGLKAAAERDRVAELMRSNAEVATGGMSDPGMRSSTNLGGTGSHSAPGRSVTGGTLGSAAVDLSVASPSRGKTIALVGAAAGGVLGIAALLALVMHSSPAREGSASASQTVPGTPLPVVGTSQPQQVSAKAASEAGAPAAGAGPEIPTLSAAALPKAPATTYPGVQGTVPVVNATPVARPPAARPAPTTKRRIDDGF